MGITKTNTTKMKKIKNPYAGLEEQGYNCFACCPENPFGLKMEFYEDGDDIVCLWNPHTNFQGWLNTLHGGIQSTLMDEVGGWLVNRQATDSRTNRSACHAIPQACAYWREYHHRNKRTHQGNEAQLGLY